MGIFIIADNQQLTASAIEIFLKRDEHNQVFYANDKNRLLQLLKQYERAVVVLEYTLFDFENEDSLLIVSERFEQTIWVLLSAELTDKFLKRVTYLLYEKCRSGHGGGDAYLLVLCGSRLDDLALHLHFLDIFKSFLQLGDLLFDERL